MERSNEFKRDDSRADISKLSGDGCHSCCHNPRFISMRKKVGKPKVSEEAFEEAMQEFVHAYGVELEKETYDVYWNHLAYHIFTDEELKDAFYSCIDAYPEFPAISEIIEMGVNLNSLKEG